MTGFLLDTNVLSEFARTGEPDRRVDRWLKTTAEESFFASVLTFAEIRRGIELLPPGKRRAQLEQWQDDLGIPEGSDLIWVDFDTSSEPAPLAVDALQGAVGNVVLCLLYTTSPKR